MEIMFVQKINNNYFQNKQLLGFMGEISDLNTLVTNTEFLKYNENNKVKALIRKNIDLVKTFDMQEEILNKKIKDLSLTERRILVLVKTILLSPELIVLNNFDVGINEKMLNAVIRFLKTSNANYNIKFVIISRNVKFLNKIVKDVIIMKNKIIKYQGNIIVGIKQGIIEKPPIIKFIDMANKKDAKLEYTLDEKELLKSIYRSVY